MTIEKEPHSTIRHAREFVEHGKCLCEFMDTKRGNVASLTCWKCMLEFDLNHLDAELKKQDDGKLVCPSCGWKEEPPFDEGDLCMCGDNFKLERCPTCWTKPCQCSKKNQAERDNDEIH